MTAGKLRASHLNFQRPHHPLARTDRNLKQNSPKEAPKKSYNSRTFRLQLFRSRNRTMHFVLHETL